MAVNFICGGNQSTERTLPVIPPISTKRPTTYHFWNILATVKNLAIKNIISLASSKDDNVFL
jgi:hypothetical protein